MTTYTRLKNDYRNLSWLFFHWIRSIKDYLKERYEHLKSCFTSITPSETNYHRNPIYYQYQCVEIDCGKIFEMNNEDQYCPYCGSRGYIPVSGIRRSISFNNNELILNNNVERIDKLKKKA